MNAGRGRTVLANISAGLLVAGAIASCITVAINGESALNLAIPASAPFVLASLITASIAWRERRAKLVLTLATLVLVAGGGVAAYEFLAPPPHAVADNSELPAKFQKLVPLHTVLPKPQSGEWLDRHVELGQSYGQYVEGRPVRPDQVRRTIYVQPLGEFNATERKILKLTAEFLGLYFQLPVKVSDDLPLSLVPERARRNHPRDGTPQVLTDYVLRNVLKPRLPPDAVALIALTASDLWPGEDWNFVFGQATLADRVGVWSMHRLGNPDESDEAFVRTLRRTLHISAHETGHMFSMHHCIYYQCCLNGSNHLAELDRQPLWLCPQCQAKLAYATGADSVKQFTELIAFAQTHGLAPEAAFWRKSLATIEGK